jgi:hypothetical protein
MGFLKPTKAEKAEIARRAEAKAIEKKKKQKVDAEKRKAERERAAARVEEIEKNVHSPGWAPDDAEFDVPALPPCDPEIDAFLQHEVFYGASSFEDKEAVKRLCGTGTTRWDAERKLWGTSSVARVEELLRSGLWAPVELHKRHFNGLLAELDARNEHAQRVQAAKRAALAAKRERETATKLAADRDAERKRATEAEATAAREAAKAAEEERAAQRAAARKRANEEAEASGAPLERSVGLMPTTREVEACRKLGVTRAAILHSPSIGWLGPTDGTSLEGRLLRWVDVLEYAVRDANPDLFFDPVALAPLQRERVTEFVDEINALAAR